MKTNTGSSSVEANAQVVQPLFHLSPAY